MNSLNFQAIGEIDVDFTETTHVSLCAGYGGIDLGLKRAIPSLRTVAYSEIEAFACEVLLARMESGQIDAAPIWSDVKTFPWESFRDRVDILSFGYPCQPFSAVGKRLGTEDPRHLWPYIANGIDRMRPSVCFAENVEGHISLGLSTVISDLEEMGYKVSFEILSASLIGAPHQRKRVFIMAHRCEQGLERHPKDGLENAKQRRINEKAFRPTSKACLWPSGPYREQKSWEPPRTIESTLGRDVNGTSDRMDHAKLHAACDSWVDELRLLGNGVIPKVAELAFKLLWTQRNS